MVRLKITFYEMLAFSFFREADSIYINSVENNQWEKENCIDHTATD
jgi:hypothetical protein